MGAGELDGVVHEGVELDAGPLARAVPARGGEDGRVVGRHRPTLGAVDNRAAPGRGPGTVGRMAVSGEVVAEPAVPGVELGRLVGHGGTCQVWEGVREADGRRVAVKVARGEHADVEAAVREASLAAVAAGAHVVPVEACLPLVDGRVALVMPLLRGGDLARLVAARGHLAPGEVVTVLAPVAGALGRLHRAGVTHGDLSPGNVLLDLDGRPSLADLGTGRVVGEEPTAVWGTEGYLAPEVLMGEEPGPAADVYALGALGWLCLTGEPPGPPGLRPSLSRLCRAGEGATALVEVVESAVAPHPADRPTADELAWSLFGAAPAAPLHLVEGDDEVSAVTYRLRAAASRAAVAEPSPGRGRPARHARVERGGWRRLPWRTGLLALSVAAVVGAGVALTGAGGVPGPGRGQRDGPDGRIRAHGHGGAQRLLAAAHRLPATARRPDGVARRARVATAAAARGPRRGPGGGLARGRPAPAGRGAGAGVTAARARRRRGRAAGACRAAVRRAAATPSPTSPPCRPPRRPPCCVPGSAPAATRSWGPGARGRGPRRPRGRCSSTSSGPTAAGASRASGRRPDRDGRRRPACQPTSQRTAVSRSPCSWTKPLRASTSPTTRWLPRMSLGELAQRDVQREPGHGKDRGTVEGVAERFRDLLLAGGLRPDEVHRAGELRVVQEVEERADLVGEGDPRPELPAGPERSGEPQPGGTQQRAGGPAVGGHEHPRAVQPQQPPRRVLERRQDQAGAGVRDRCPGRDRGRGRGLPRLHDVGEEALPGCAVLGEVLLAAVAVEAHRRAADQPHRPAGWRRRRWRRRGWSRCAR